MLKLFGGKLLKAIFSYERFSFFVFFVFSYIGMSMRCLPKMFSFVLTAKTRECKSDSLKQTNSNEAHATSCCSDIS